MKSSQKILLLLCLVLLAAAAAGVVLTRGTSSLPFGQRRPEQTAAKGAAPLALVDQQPLSTARELSRLATSPEEQPLAKEAIRIADHEVDLAFAVALRQAAEKPVVPNAQTRDILARLHEAEKLTEADQLQISRLTQQLAIASGGKKTGVEQELELARAQLELDQDELEDAKQDLIRAGGDPQSRIRRMVEEHEAGQHQDHGAPPATAPGASAAAISARGLAGAFEEWNRLRTKQNRLLRARREAQNATDALMREHEELEKHLAAEGSKAPALQSRSSAETKGAAPSADREAAAALLDTTRHLAADKKELAAYDKRIHDQQGLGEIYGRWSALLVAQRRAALHQILLNVTWIFLVLACVVGLSAWLDRFFARLAPDRRRLVTLRTVTRVAVQAAGVIFVLLLIFGPPAQLATIIGLAGAGLTVALKDFVVGFFGWFVLMGKNGMRLGDWVEINGVSGEVVEIGLFHTVLLETGNWTDAGHPTGRRVTFMNSFAIEGHYFNFSTSGQWLWDELHLVLPSGKDPYPVVEAIQKIAAAETQENARHAEKEWRRVTSSQGMGGFSADPSITVRPGPMGIEVAVRYITRANERHRLRSKLYQAAVRLLGSERNAGRPARETPSTAPDAAG